ncbi:MAG: anti-phage deoxyguanosine triphosphatase [Advenella sp.]
MIDPVWQERIFNDTHKDTDVRTEWEHDYARLIHSSAFRRLQSKTQVLGLGESDFYRTRLTHSMEVAQIGTGIVSWLKEKYKEEKEILNALPCSALMNTICLAHDIGHPPFGHGGEVALNVCMREFGGFEGNGQTLRILSKLDKYTEKNGMNPTRRVLLGVLKYPAAYGDVVQQDAYGTLPNQRWLCVANKQKPPKCYLDDERDVVSWIFSPLTEYEKISFIKLQNHKSGHLKPIYKALDTSIMELADDISYSLHDLEDAIALKMVTREDWDAHFALEKNKKLFPECGLVASDISNELFSGKSHIRKKCIGRLIHKLIISISVEDSGLPDATTSLLKWNAKMDRTVRAMMKSIADLIQIKVIQSPNVQQLEFKGQKLIIELFEALASDPERLLPDPTKEKHKQADTEAKKMRVICDYVSGMTDDFATRLYEKIYHPHKGSIFDRL